MKVIILLLNNLEIMKNWVAMNSKIEEKLIFIVDIKQFYQLFKIILQLVFSDKIIKKIKNKIINNKTVLFYLSPNIKKNDVFKN